VAFNPSSIIPPTDMFGSDATTAGHIATIQRLVHQDDERVATIQRLTELDSDRVATIQRLMELDASRIATIERLVEHNRQLTASLAHLPVQQSMQQDDERSDAIRRLMELDADRVATIQGLMTLDAGRVAKIDSLAKGNELLASSLKQISGRFYETDGLIAMDRNLEFMDEPVFAEAWRKSREANKEGWPGGVPDVRWRAAIAVWAARNGLRLEGDFVECGVHTGLFSLVIFHALKFEKEPRSFYLFDTFNGIPLSGLEGIELEHAVASNAGPYVDVWDIARRNFAPFKNAKLVKGRLPDTLSEVDIGPISYLLVDLNIAAPEKAVIETLWDRLVPGAAVIIDDYGWSACKAQYDMWNAFAKRVDHHIAPLPTGQGLLIKR
jgi:O-methyltransferase